MANPLLGKRIRQIFLADDRFALKFELETGEFLIARAYDDCCSYTWIENIENPEAVIGSEVLLAEDIEMPESLKPSTFHPDSDCLQFYGFKIQTAKGTCVIDYRNDSNGYYGGSLNWGGYFYGGVFGQCKSSEVWKDAK